MRNLKSLLTVIKFTMKELVTKKPFIVSTIIFILLIIVAFNIPKILTKLGIDQNLTSKLLIVDDENIYEGTLETLSQMDLGYEISVTNEEKSIDDLKNMINNGEIDTAVVVNLQGNTIKLDYIVKNTGMATSSDLLINILNKQYKSLQISKLGLTNEQMQSITPIFETNLLQAEETEVESNMFIVMIISLALFMGIYMFAYQVSLSITTEKTSKIVETLITIVPPKIIVIGKTIAIGLVGIMQILLLGIVAYISANIFLEEGMIEELLNISNLSHLFIITTIVYFILGYFLFAFLYALTGATVSKPEDVQSANGPVAILSIFGFYLAYFSMMNPTSEINYFASIFPLSSPFSMPTRIMMGLTTNADIIISIAVLIISIIIISKISVRIYENTILSGGTKLNIKNIVKLYKRK